MIFSNPNLFQPAADLSVSASSLIIPMTQKYGALIQVALTGAPVGTLKLQETADLVPSASGNWTDVPSSAQSVSAAGVFGWNVDRRFCTGLQVIYTRSSGTGSMTGSACAKGFK